MTKRAKEAARGINLVHVITVPQTLAFFRGQIGFMRQKGLSSAVISSPGERIESFCEEERAPVYEVPMQRRITPGRDLVALARIVRRLRAVQPEIVHSHTPKGGLLGMIASWLMHAPVKVYSMRGLPMMTASGWRRSLLRWTDVISCRLAQRVICVSRSLQKEAIKANLCDPDKLVVLGDGSGNGVDAAGRFNPERYGSDSRDRVRRELGIPKDARVIGYVGRLVRDKGIVELTTAWRELRQSFEDLYLVLVGPVEARDQVPSGIIETLREDGRVRMVGFVNETAPYYSTMDVVALPTYREGFPNVPLEAAAMGLPVVATAVTGCVDAVVGGVTGTLVPPRDAGALKRALEAYIVSPALCREHGDAGRSRVLADFRPERIWEALHEAYAELLEVAGPTSARTETSWYEIAKRCFDIQVALTGLVALSPVLALLLPLVRIKLGKPIFFRQQRPGLRHVPFVLVKLRTMTDARDESGALLPDEHRLTPLGRFLRSSSLDELPTLWNVLKGDMSLVGPRPLLMQYLDRYSPEQARRDDVKPGITGWAQINGRNAISWDEKFAHDVWYVDNRSFLLDFQIIAKTALAVLGRKGISHEGAVTMPEFMGSATEEV